MQCKCMKTITIDDEAYGLLTSLKRKKGDSFTKVIKRSLIKPCETAGELLDAYEQMPPPNLDPEIMDKILKDRGRRSGGRK